MDTNIWNSVESKWLQIWEQNATNTSDPISGQEKFFITVAYPYPNSPQHIGHGRTYTIADVHARYKRLRGFNVLFPMAFHYTGTPILGMAKRVQAGDKEIIENFRKIYNISDQDILTFREPLQIAKYFHNEIKAGMKEMGYSIDWRREFTTIDPVYKKLISWQFETLKKLGVIEQGSHPVGWCPNDSNPVSQHDTLGDIEPSFTEYSLIKFKLKNENVIIPVATLRPETIFGVTNLWINPNEGYTVVLVNETENWILSRSAATKLEYLNYSIKVTKTLLGKELIGSLVESPLTNRFIPILPATFVTLDEGSGIVMSVPAHAPFDMQALMDFTKQSSDYPAVLSSDRIVPIVIIDSKIQEQYDQLPDNVDSETATNKKGRSIRETEMDYMGNEVIPSWVFLKKYNISNQNDPNLEKATSELYSLEFYSGKMNEGTLEYSGMPVSKAKDLVKDRLIALKESVPFFEMTNKPVYCRCGTLCFVKLLNNQWFLNYGNFEWKTLALECLNRMEIIPSEIIKEFKNVFDWLKVRACARKTGLGTPLPWDNDWIVESLSDSVIYMVYYIISKYVNLHDLEKYSNFVDNAFFDYVLLGVKSGHFLALDKNDNFSGDLTSVRGYPNLDKSILTEFLLQSKQIREEFKYYYPLDSRHSGRDLVPNHLSFFIFNHSIIFPKPLWPKQIVVNGSVLMDGKKMSKSMGNIIPLRSTIKQFNADSIRVAMLVLGELLQDVDFSFSTLKGIYSRLNEIYEFGKDFVTKQKTSTNPKVLDEDFFDLFFIDLEWEDKWLLQRVNSTIKDVTNSFEEMRIRDALNTVLYLMDKDFEWYKKRKESRSDHLSKYNTDLFVISYFFRARIKMLAPFCPFLAEELWELLEPEKGSIFQDDWPSIKSEFVNPVTDENEQEISNILDDLHKILKVTKNTQLKIIHIYLSANDKKILYDKVLNLVTNSNTKNFGHVMKSLLSDSLISLEHKNLVKSNPDLLKKINEDILSLSPLEQQRRINIGLFDEYNALMDGIGLLSFEFGIQETCIKIYYEDDPKIYDPKNKAKFSRPFKPAIYLE